MHGGLVDARFFEPNLAPLAERFHVYTPERRGHGHTPDVEGPITYQLMADDTIAFLETVVGEPADLVGHSDGAFVAMLVAMQRPELVKRLVMISGGFNKTRRGGAGHGVGRRADRRVPRPRLRRGVPRRRSTTSRSWRPRSARWPRRSRTCEHAELAKVTARGRW